jgi:hypothetical protein
MKIQLDFTDDDNLLLDIREALFVTLLKAELTDSKLGLERSFHKDDKVMFKSNIKACKALLSYYTGEDDGQA